MKNTDKVTLTIGQIKKLIKESKWASNEEKFNKFKTDCELFANWMNEAITSLELDKDLKGYEPMILESRIEWAEKYMKEFKNAFSKVINFINK